MAEPTLYRAIVTSKFRTEKLLSFYNSIHDGIDGKTIYTTIGRSQPWSDNEKDVGFAPPYPIDDVSGVVDMWSHMIGAVKVSRTYMDAVISRRDWGDVRYPDPRTFKIGEIVVVNSAPYNRTDVSTGWMIYRVVDVPLKGMCSIANAKDKEECLKLGGEWTPSIQSFEPPTGKGDGETTIINSPDGYVWEYLYTIPPDVSINRCTNEYIVVPTPVELREDPIKWGFEDNLSWKPYDDELVFRLKVNRLRFKAYIDPIYFPESSKLGNDGFRQISIIINPLLKKNHPTDPDVKATKESYLVGDLERHSGEMIYMENRPPITKSTDQTEEINIVFSF